MISRLLAVYAVYLLAAMTPGPSVVYVMRTSVGSRGMGLRAALGIATSTTLWVCIAALGLSTVFRDSPRLMEAIRLLGGAYFLHLSWRLGRSASTADAAQAQAAPAARGTWQTYAQGVATNATNPGTALFFTSLLGLYNIHGMAAPAQLAAYAGIPVLSVSWYSGLALAFSDERLSSAYLRLRRPLDGGLAVLFLVLGIKLILLALR